MLTTRQLDLLRPGTYSGNVPRVPVHVPAPVASAYSAFREYVRDFVSRHPADTFRVDRREPEPTVLGLFWCPEHAYVSPLPDRFDCPYDMPYDPSSDPRPVVRSMVQLNPS